MRPILRFALLCIASTAHADDLTTYTALAGRCTGIVAIDVAAAAVHCPKVVAIEFPSGRSGFMFLLNRSGATPLVFSFFGDGAKRLHPDAATTIQPIDRVYFTIEGRTDDVAAAGSCRLAKPHTAAHARISCSADTDRGRFAGEFIGDGTAPETSQLR
jgi:hypothetical protein